MSASSAAAARRLLLLRRRNLLPSLRLSSSSAADGLDDGGGGGGRVKIFDRDLKRWHRDRAAWAAGETDALTDTVAENLVDRLEDCRKAFPSALCLGGSAGAVRRALRGRGELPWPLRSLRTSSCEPVAAVSTAPSGFLSHSAWKWADHSRVPLSGGIEKLVMMDMSADMVKKWREVDDAAGDGLETHFVIGDEEFLPIKER
jgi:NADH dehydrogenase [ubiquinone] 1 alpha subcomplex assembly factor 5